MLRCVSICLHWMAIALQTRSSVEILLQHCCTVFCCAKEHLWYKMICFLSPQSINSSHTMSHAFEERPAIIPQPMYNWNTWHHPHSQWAFSQLPILPHLPFCEVKVIQIKGNRRAWNNRQASAHLPLSPTCLQKTSAWKMAPFNPRPSAGNITPIVWPLTLRMSSTPFATHPHPHPLNQPTETLWGLFSLQQHEQGHRPPTQQHSCVYPTQLGLNDLGK